MRMSPPGRPGSGAGPHPTLGIVVPTLNEEEHLPSLLDDLSRIPHSPKVVISDGGSRDRTVGLAREAGAGIIQGPPGRGSQMNAGAGSLSTDWLLFLHADTRIPPRARRALADWLRSASPSDIGTFAFALDGDAFRWRIVEAGQRMREKLLGLAYGDQGLLVHQELFKRVGGFRDLPVMEDVDILRRLRRVGRWKRVPAPLLTHPRRLQEGGALRGWFRNAALISLYVAGVSPARLAPFYPPRRAQETHSLLVFAKAPVAGKVKTRLAREVGAEEAARIYSVLGKKVVAQVKGGPFKTVVCFDPPDALDMVKGWLGEEGIDFLPQVSGDLGARMGQAVRESLATSWGVVIIGTDAPEVTGAVVQEAFEKLKSADLVIGPALDGGYYLLGSRAFHPALFTGIPWSSHQVLERTLERARTLGLRVAHLSPLQDVDTLRDWERVKGTLV